MGDRALLDLAGSRLGRVSSRKIGMNCVNRENEKWSLIFFQYRQFLFMTLAKRLRKTLSLTNTLVREPLLKGKAPYN